MPSHEHQHDSDYEENSLTLLGAVSMGTSVMIGAGILALTGQHRRDAHRGADDLPGPGALLPEGRDCLPTATLTPFRY